MSLLNRLKNTTYLPPKQHTPVIPSHPSIPYCPKNDEILHSGPRKKRISYKSQDEKREALRERSRDNRRKAKERKEYMERRIRWLEYENPQMYAIVSQKVARVKSLRQLLEQQNVDLSQLDFYAQGGAEMLYRKAGLEEAVMTIQDFDDDSESSFSSDTTRDTRSQKKSHDSSHESLMHSNPTETTYPIFGTGNISLIDAMHHALSTDGSSNLEHSDTSSRLFVL